MIANSADDFLENDIRNVDPWKVIKASAEGMCIKIRNPKPSCKHCHGRGWVGRKADTGEPIACRCIFEKEVYDSQRELGDWSRPVNREQRRAKKKQNKTKEK